MQFFKKNLKKENGFTLVELMVVVAIIGLLSAVAVPNLKKYQAKTKTAEAKMQLSAIYTAEAGFFSDYNMYHRCLTYMGYDPGPEAFNRYYMTGFSGGFVTIDPTAIVNAQNSGLIIMTGTGCSFLAAGLVGGVGVASNNSACRFAAGKGIGSSIANVPGFLPTTSLGDQSDAANMYYTAGAGGIISAGFVTSPNHSQFTIDHNKVLRNVANGF